MSRESIENRAVGSVIVGVVVGAIVGFFSAAYLTMYGLASGRLKLIEYPVPIPHRWSAWEIWTIGIGVTVGVLTAIFVSRTLFKSGQAADKSKRLSSR
jgi:high-affinity Fe2+/Pb2+ permease